MTHSAETIERATSVLNKPKSVAFLTKDGTVAELRFANAVAAADCRNSPESMIARHKLVKMLTDVTETATALLKEPNDGEDVL